MHRQAKFLAAMALITIAMIPLAVNADVEVGVSKGEWIEYNVTTTGHLEDHDAQWARMEVANVLGPIINLNVTTQFTNGTYLIENVSLNLETGKLGDDFFIPAGLSPGDTFYDARLGNITITGSETRTYAGAKREVLLGQTPNTNFYWDKETGILVEATSSYSSINFTIKTVTSNTNIWPAENSGFSFLIIYSFVGAVVIALVLTVLFLWFRQSRQRRVN